MTDEYQIHIPESFHALYVDGRRRLGISMKDLRARYELCEDLAQQLVDHARTIQAAGIADDEVLSRCLAGMENPAAGLAAQEPRWVVTRLAELLGWPALPAPGPRQ